MHPAFKKIKETVFVFLLLFISSLANAQVVDAPAVPCNPPGWNVWLGLSDDWNDGANWCAGVPTNTTDVLIPGTGGAGYFHPVIKSGVVANAKKLMIENDTLEINAPSTGSLTVSDSLYIKSNSLLINRTDEVMMGNGVVTNPNYLVFRGAFREQKIQLIYKASEFLSMGIKNGDVISALCFPIRVRRSTAPYPVTIKMYYATNNATYPNFINIGFTSPVPMAPANCLAPQLTVPLVVYSGPIDLTTIPLNGSGTVTVNLTAPFVFNNTVNPLIVEVCYSAPSTSLNDEMYQTQTLGLRSVLLLSNLGVYAPAACAWTNTAPNGTTLTQRLASEFRPNICFKFQTPYGLYPINVKGNWKNNGNFIAGKSNVTLNGTGPSNQCISGTASTAFYDLTINNNATGVKLFSVFNISHVLTLQNGKLNLNSRSISILNSGTDAVVRTSGGILSETVSPNYSSVEWAIGATTGLHVFPFQTSNNSYIPFSYNVTSGNAGAVSAATYPTAVNNLPYPTGVTNVNDTNNVNNSAFTIDRFWHLTKTGTSGKAKLKFTYLNTEAPSPIVNGNIRAHRYNPTNNRWKILPYSMTNTVNSPSPGTSEVLVIGVAGNNLNANEWALADASSPLRMSHPAQNEIDLFPNPFSDKIIFSWDNLYGKNESISLTLYSITGEVTAKTIIPGNLISDQQFEWSQGNLKNGIYFLVLQSGDKIQTKRVIRMGNY